MAITECFEELAEGQGLETMRGGTPEERAALREMLGFTEQMKIPALTLRIYTDAFYLRQK